jgi:hypothetical protein
MAPLRSDPSDRLRRICGGCALAFLLCIIVAILLDGRGIGTELAALVITLVPLALYCAVALAASTVDPLEFRIADRRISAGFAGMAAAVQWSAPALVLAAPASLFVAGYDGRPMLIGLTGGYLLLARRAEGRWLTQDAFWRIPDGMPMCRRASQIRSLPEWAGSMWATTPAESSDWHLALRLPSPSRSSARSPQQRNRSSLSPSGFLVARIEWKAKSGNAARLRG